MIFRNPVFDPANPERRFEIAHPLACVDVTHGGTRCSDARLLHPIPEPGKKGKMFVCPNRGSGAGKCSSWTFMYPRKWRSGGKVFHFHQGLDIFAESGTPIRSVTDGVVVYASEGAAIEGFGGYGLIVVVASTIDGRRCELLYAHCKDVFVRKDDPVLEQQIIATVGTTCGSAGSPMSFFPESEAHLHFEASTRPYSFDDERFPGDGFADSDRGRVEPQAFLESLGPWGMQEVHLPVGGAFRADDLAVVHGGVEGSKTGGYFPLGANNHWHGGVHLPTKGGKDVVAPFDATIVAARLDPDSKTAMAFEGSVNFILLRHEISPTFYDMFRRNDPAWVEPKPKELPKPKKRAVGTKSNCANDPEDVKLVKRKLWDRFRWHPDPDDPEREHEHDESCRRYYSPPLDGGGEPPDLDDGTIAKPLKNELRDAIKAFQKERVKVVKADGVVDIPGKTWSALHDGSPPKEPEKPVTPTTDPTVAPPKAEVDPKRVLYSLLMHLEPLAITDSLAGRFKWLSRVKLTPDPVPPTPTAEEEEEKKLAEAEREADEVEARSHVITGAVGAPNKEGQPAENLLDDVRWVHLRLIRFGFSPGPMSAVCTEHLIGAIRDFQNVHHKGFKKTGAGDGRVDTKGDTIKKLRMTKAELLKTKGSGGGTKKPTVDPALPTLAAERDADGLAKVMTGLDVKVSSGEALWASGQARGYGPDDDSLPMLDQIHWEIFSEHLLVTDWEDPPIVDLDEDLRADVPKMLTDFVEADSPALEKDGLLTTREVRRFYVSGNGHFLRRTPCQFMNHWALDVDKALVKLAEMGYDTSDLADHLRPMMWWDKAADVLPASKVVWHYNPIELLGQYARYMESIKPIEPGPPDTHPTLVVWVLYVDGRPIPDIQVELYWGIEPTRAAKTRADGSAWFHAVPVGDYGVRVLDPVGQMREVNVLPMASKDEHNHFVFSTDVVGPPPKRGNLNARVRAHTGFGAPLVEVQLHPDSGGGPVLSAVTDRDGRARFENIVHGPYTLTAGEAAPVHKELNRKEATAPELKLPRPIVLLWLLCRIDGKAASYRRVEIRHRKDKSLVDAGVTDADGEVKFMVRQDRYHAWIGTHRTTVKAPIEKPKEPIKVLISTKHGPAPERLEGRLDVSVTRYEDDSPAVTALIFVSDPTNGIWEADYLGASGVATFDLPAGSYTVSVDDESKAVEVLPNETTAISFEVDE